MALLKFDKFHNYAYYNDFSDVQFTPGLGRINYNESYWTQINDSYFTGKKCAFIESVPSYTNAGTQFPAKNLNAFDAYTLETFAKIPTGYTYGNNTFSYLSMTFLNLRSQFSGVLGFHPQLMFDPVIDFYDRNLYTTGGDNSFVPIISDAGEWHHFAFTVKTEGDLCRCIVYKDGNAIIKYRCSKVTFDSNFYIWGVNSFVRTQYGMFCARTKLYGDGDRFPVPTKPYFK